MVSTIATHRLAVINNWLTITCVLLVLTYNIPITVEMCNMKLREKFMENAHVKDLRTIDLLVVKVRIGQFNLKQNSEWGVLGSNGIDRIGQSLETETSYYDVF